MAAALLLVAVTGTVFATRQAAPGTQPAQLTDENEDAEGAEAVDADALDRASERLGFDRQQLADLAATYGLGGAVRLVAWSSESGKTIEEIAAMRDTGGPDGGPMGWGQIAKELDVHPGIGSIMGNGHGRDDAPGQQKQGSDEDVDSGE